MKTMLTFKGRITLPSAVRTRLGLATGDRVSVTVVDDCTIVLKRLAPEAVVSLRGLLARPKQALSIEKMKRDAAAHLRSKGR